MSGDDDYVRKRELLLSDLNKLKSAISDLQDELKKTKRKIKDFQGQRDSIERRLHDLDVSHAKKTLGPQAAGNKYCRYLLPQRWDEEVDTLLQNIFGLQRFRPLQREVINCTLMKKDAFLIMPTGGGKSLTYQLSALVGDDSSVTIVVSPLIALIQDQVAALQEIGINAIGLSSDKKQKELQKERLKQLVDNDDGDPIRLVYLSPEMLVKNKSVQNKIKQLHKQNRLARIVIDEAHCCSEWGHDFRPNYTKLRLFRETVGLNLRGVPILAVTATATEQVQKDVMKILQMQDAEIFITGFNRPNLFYEVRTSTGKKIITEMAELIQTDFKNQSGLIYCRTKKDCLKLLKEFADLNPQMKRIMTVYHGGMKADSRRKVLKAWLKNQFRVVIATIAFGMGINKKDVRFVFHNSLSKNIQNYYQESGRAGRDGKTARCIVWYRPGDAIKRICSVASDSYSAKAVSNTLDMIPYFTFGNRCRRSMMSHFFGENLSSEDCKGMCDTCKYRQENQECSKLLETLPLARVIARILRHPELRKEEITVNKMVAAVRGKGDGKLGGVLSALQIQPIQGTVLELTHMVLFLLQEGFIGYEFYTTAYDYVMKLKPGPRQNEVLEDHGLNLSSTITSLPFHLFVPPKGRRKSSIGQKRKRSMPSAPKPPKKKRKTSKGPIFIGSESDSEEPIVKKKSRKKIDIESSGSSFLEDDIVLDKPKVKIKKESKPEKLKKDPPRKNSLTNRVNNLVNCFSKKKKPKPFFGNAKSLNQASESHHKIKKRHSEPPMNRKKFAQEVKRKPQNFSRQKKVDPDDLHEKLLKWRDGDIIQLGALSNDILLKIANCATNFQDDEDMDRVLIRSCLPNDFEDFTRPIYEYLKQELFVTVKVEKQAAVKRPFKRPRANDSKQPSIHGIFKVKSQKKRAQSLPLQNQLGEVRVQKQVKRRRLTTMSQESD